MEALDQIMDALFTPYRKRVPDVGKIILAMQEKGMIQQESDIENDHVAFRTLGVPHLGIASFEKIFLHYGYTKMDPYFFAKKKLDAYWYAPPNPKYPRIFISELRVQDLSEASQKIIHRFTQSITSDPVDALDLNNAEQVGAFFHHPLWNLPTAAEYETLAEESEYAAWVIYNRYYLNHYTISVHALPGHNTLEKFTAFLEEIGVILNTSGGKIKVSPDGLLRQSSSVAKMIPATFSCGTTQEIPGSYVEFAERLPLPQHNHLSHDELERQHRREGFEAGNADKIFESTFREQTQKNQ
ncbi:MAG: DUF1338 domain-containing protein [Flavobacteriaceae bacterium]